MKRNKKTAKTLFLLTSVFGLVGCNRENTPAMPNTDCNVLTFDFNDGESRPYKLEVEKGKKVEKAIDTPLRTGYTFTDWYSEKENGTKISFPFELSQDTTIYAHWEPAKFNAVFDYNYEGAPESKTFAIDYKASVDALTEIPERNNFVFRYWSTKKDGSSQAQFPYVMTKDTTFYAYWIDAETKIYQITVHYGDYEGAQQDKVLEIEEGQSISAIQLGTPSRSGYDFKGWSLSENGPLITLPFTPTSDATLYAVFEERSFNAYFRYNYVDSPSTEYTSSTFHAGEDVNAPSENPTRPGYTFDGWYNAEKGGSEITFPQKPSRNSYYYAHWIHDPVVTDTFQAEYVTFDPNVIYPGFSGSTSGDGCILSGNFTGISVDDSYTPNSQVAAGKAFCVSYQYTMAAVLTFTIEASEEISNASLIANWATERDVTFGPTGDSAYAVKVNGSDVNYSPITITSGGNNSIGSFQEYTLSTTVHLNKGTNTITMQPMNSNALMTMQAYAPITDYIRISYGSTGKLSWRPVYDNINGK